MKKSDLLDVSKAQRGLPCKSYIYLLELDRELYLFLSYINDAPFFDYYISSLIRRYHRSNDREKAVELFLKFTSTANADRISFIYPSKILDRLSCLRLLNTLCEGIQRYVEIRSKLRKKQKLSQEEYVFYFFFRRRWITNEMQLIRQITSIKKKVNGIINMLYQAHLHFITKYLLKNRRGVFKLKDQLVSAYEIILEVINIYNPHRSKVPFFKLAQKYTYNYKNRIIKEDTWGLDSTLIHLDALLDTKVLFENASKTEIKFSDEIYDESSAERDFEECIRESQNSDESINLDDNEVIDVPTQEESESDKENSESDKENIDYVENKTIAIKNNIWKSIEASLYYEKKQDDKIKLIEMAYQSLPKPIKDIASILYGLVDPFTTEQELELEFLTRKKES